MTCIGISHESACWIENGIETGNKHPGRDFCIEQFVGSREYLAWRSCLLGCSTDHSARGSHHQSCWNTFTSDITNDKTQSAVFKRKEIVEIATDLTSRLVEWNEVPSTYGRHVLGHNGALNLLSGAQFLLDAFVLTHLRLLSMD